MLVLLDENLPHRLRSLITGHDVRTVAYQKWNALTNGALLKTAEDAGFDVMVTADKNIQCQQNMQGRKIALVVLSKNERDIATRNVPGIAAAIKDAKPGSLSRSRCSDDAVGVRESP